MMLISGIGLLVSRVRFATRLAAATNAQSSMDIKHFLTHWFTGKRKPMQDREVQLHQQILALLDKPWYGIVAPGSDGKFIVDTLRELTHHHNGYVREKAVVALALKQDVAALGDLLICVNDWVKPIHLAAVDAVKALLTPANVPAFIAHLPALRQLAARKRYDHREFVQTITHYLVSHHLPAVQHALASSRRDVRDAALHALIGHDKLHDEAALLQVLANQDSTLRAMAVEDWLSHNRALSASLQTRLLRDPWVRIRRAVLFYLDEHRQLPPEALYCPLLLDKNALIQQRTRRMLEGKKDATAFWLEVLSSEHFTLTQRRSALYGLKESRYVGITELAQWAYQHQALALRKAALPMLASLKGENARAEVLGSLADAQLAMTLTAWKVLNRSSLILTPDEVQQLLDNPPTPSHRFVYWRLPHLLNKWDWLILLLRNTAQISAGERDAQCHLWVSRFNHAGIAPTPPQRDTLAALLPQAPEIRRIIAGYLP